MNTTNSTHNPHWHPDTQAIRQSLPRSQYNEHSEALYLTSSFVQPDASTCAHNFAHPEDGYTYSRTGNPTVSSFEQRLSALEQAPATVATASGMSAILALCMGLLKAGDHIVCSQSMFGSTISLLGNIMARFGVQASFVAQTRTSDWQAAIRPNTRLLFAETPTNPLTDLCDIAALANIAHNAGALLAVDNSFLTPVLQRPMALGADIVIHSGTKFLDGQGRVMAGALCCSEELANTAFLPIVRTAGMTLSPFNAWIVLKGLETLPLRVKAQSANALHIAQWLAQHPQIEHVYYPGLASHPQHQLAMQQQSGSGGAVLSFSVRTRAGDATPEQIRHNAFTLINQTRLCSITSNLGDVKTTITHPATTSHGKLSEEQRQSAGVVQNLIRLAVGLEHPDDICADLARGLDNLGQ